MTVECLICGSMFDVPKGNCKYCRACRQEIERTKYLSGGFSNAVKNAIAMHKEERDATVRANKLRKRNISIDIVVKEAKLHGRSYGHEVAVMEGRMYK